MTRDDETIESLYAAFTFLWNLAHTGDDLIKQSNKDTADLRDIEKAAYEGGHKEGHQQAILAVREIVERKYREYDQRIKDICDSGSGVQGQLEEGRFCANEINRSISYLLPAPGDYVKKIYLDESIRLQSHYADLLNMQDGGQRIIFKNSDEWIKRLDSLGEK